MSLQRRFQQPQRVGVRTPDATARLAVKFAAFTMGNQTSYYDYALNAWRVTFTFVAGDINNEAGAFLLLDGVPIVGQTYSGNAGGGNPLVSFSIGGAYDANGRPLYMNQIVRVSLVNDSARPFPVFVVEERHEINTRQNQ